METWGKVVLAVAAGVSVFALLRTSKRDGGGGVILGPMPKQFKGVSFAVGNDPVWPLRTKNSRGLEVPYVDIEGKTHGNYARRFGADRSDHWHQGVDLYCDVGDPVVACEPGTISGVFNTFHLGTGAVVLVTDSGLTLVYGEIGPGTWHDFGVTKGLRVARGQELARVEPNTAGTHMLHFEIYKGAFSTNDPPHSALLDPTIYLLDALTNPQGVA